jgi:hypothetical protein
METSGMWPAMILPSNSHLSVGFLLSVEEKMIPFVKKYLGDKAPLNQAVIKLLPLVDIHFTNGGSISTVYFLLAVSFFILA